ncbi:MAG: HEAT repeat domain-containing protein [Bacteroidia bacterium]
MLRHNLIREGASFRTEDEPFFWSDNEDFHPTDVLEDADGSLLVVETGGWFILGCPLSQVSKPQLKGSIYRIRKNGTPKVKDPYGNQINWLSLSSEELAVLLEDSRPFVSDRAQKYLIENQAIDPLKKILSQSSSVAARIKAVFALYRIGSIASLEAILPAFKDKDSPIRIAAARALGLAKYMPAIPHLSKQMRQGEAAEIRQAATAMGQIGDLHAIPILIDAAQTVEDRFIEHAIIYALISLNNPEKVLAGLENPSPKVKKFVLIALDQMKGSPIKVDQVIPLLGAEDSALQQTALWVASHHPDWTSSMKGYLATELKNEAFKGEQKEVLSSLFTGFCGNEDAGFYG